MKNRLAVIVGVLTLTLFALANASGQENASGVELSSGVARISLIHGDVSTQRGDSGDWTAGALNRRANVLKFPSAEVSLKPTCHHR